MIAARLPALVLAASFLLPALALALPSAAEKAEAEALFQDAKKLMLQKRWPDACRKLETSQRLDPAGGTLFNLAICHEEEGKLATAWVEFGDALVQAKADKKADRAKIAREHIEKLDPKLPRLTLNPPEKPTPGLQVYRDEVLVSEASFGTPIPVDPGEHTIRAVAPRFRPYEGRVTLGVGEAKSIKIPTLDPGAEPDAVAASSSAPPPPPPPDDRRLVGYVAGGVGLASLAVGAAFGLRTFSKKREADRLCPDKACSPEGLQRNDEAYTSATIANVGVGLGLVGLGVGAYLVFTSKPSNQAAWRVSPALGPGVGGLQMQGRF